MNNPLVSIIVPIYNVEKYLRKCLDSILNQTYSNIEVILVNDGSTDQSELIIQSYLEIDKRVNYIFQENAGPSMARNRGMIEATGEFICFIDADDIVFPDYVMILVNKILEGYDIVACGYREISKYGDIDLNDFYKSSCTLSKNEFVDGILNRVGGTLWAKIYRHSIIQTNELRLNPNVYMCEDLLFNLDYCYYACDFAAVESSLYRYNRLNERSITSKVMLSYLENYLIIIENMEKKLKKLGWDNQQLELLINQRILSITMSIASNESAQLIKLGLLYCSNQLKLLLENPFVQESFKDYYTNKVIMDRGVYYLKKKQFKKSVIYFYIIEQIRSLKVRLNTFFNMKRKSK